MESTPRPHRRPTRRPAFAMTNPSYFKLVIGFCMGLACISLGGTIWLLHASQWLSGGFLLAGALGFMYMAIWACLHDGVTEINPIKSLIDGIFRRHDKGAPHTN